MNFDHLSRADRDVAICRAYEFGFTYADVGRAFGLSGQRIRQILDKHSVPPRSTCIPPLVWFDHPSILEGLGDQ